jgi:hypothetical protein
VDIKISGHIFTTSISGEAIANLTDVSDADSADWIKYESHKQRQKQERLLNGIRKELLLLHKTKKAFLF